jgi:hypothetical protein
VEARTTTHEPDRVILHIDLDCFFVQVEQRAKPQCVLLFLGDKQQANLLFWFVFYFYFEAFMGGP